MFSRIPSARDDVRRVRELHFVFEISLLSRNARNGEILYQTGQNLLGRRSRISDVFKQVVERVEGGPLLRITEIVFIGVNLNKKLVARKFHAALLEDMRRFG